MQPGKGGRGGGKAEASGAGGGSAELSKHLGALQVAAGQHVSSRSAQVRRPRPLSGALAPQRWTLSSRLRCWSGLLRACRWTLVGWKFPVRRLGTLSEARSCGRLWRCSSAVAAR